MLAWVLCLKLVSPGVETQAWIRPRLGPPARVLVTPVYPQVQRTRSQGGGEAWRLSALSLVSVARHLLGLRQASAVRAEFVPPAEDLDIEARNRGVPSRWPPQRCPLSSPSKQTLWARKPSPAVTLFATDKRGHGGSELVCKTR